MLLYPRLGGTNVPNSEEKLLLKDSKGEEFTYHIKPPSPSPPRKCPKNVFIRVFHIGMCLLKSHFASSFMLCV